MPVFLDGKGRYHRYFLTCKDGIFRRELFRFDGKAVFFFLTGRHGPFFFGGNVFAGRDHEQKKKTVAESPSPYVHTVCPSLPFRQFKP